MYLKHAFAVSFVTVQSTFHSDVGRLDLGDSFVFILNCILK